MLGFDGMFIGEGLYKLKFLYVTESSPETVRRGMWRRLFDSEPLEVPSPPPSPIFAEVLGDSPVSESVSQYSSLLSGYESEPSPEPSSPEPYSPESSRSPEYTPSPVSPVESTSEDLREKMFYFVFADLSDAGKTSYLCMRNDRSNPDVDAYAVCRRMVYEWRGESLEIWEPILESDIAKAIFWTKDKVLRITELPQFGEMLRRPNPNFTP